MKLCSSIALLLCVCVLPAAAQPAAVPTVEEIQKITSAAPDKPTATPLRPRKLLVFSRSDAVKHSAIPYGAKAVEIMGHKTGAYAAVHSDDLAIFTPERLKDFDALFFNNGYGFKLDEAPRRALMEFVESGKGLAAIHAASANFVGWPEGTRLFNARFKTHPWTPKDEWAVRNEDPAHPLNAVFGGKGFRVKDEIYVFSDFHRHRVRVLLSLDLTDERTAKVPHTDAYAPISWVHTVGKGRVFFCSLGHVHDLFWTPAILRHYLDGIQFALGDLKADAEPTPAAREWAFTTLMADRTGDIRPPLDALAEQIKEAGQDKAKRATLEQRMLQVLRSDAPAQTKRVLCEPLSQVATTASVPAVAALLSDPELSHSARTVLERVGPPEGPAVLQAALLAAFAERGDAAAAPLALRGLASEDANLRSAAIRAVAALAGADGVLPLADIASRGERDEKLAARQHLVQLRGKDVDQTMLRLAKDGQPEVRAVLMGVLADRKTPSAAPLMLETARGADTKVAVEALKALGRLASAAEMPELVQLVLVTQDDSVRDAARGALAATAKRVGHLQPVFAAWPNAAAPAKAALLRVLGEVGGDQSLVELTNAARAAQPEVKRAAVLALADVWSDTRPLTTLLEIAKTDADAGLRIRALRGYLRLLGLGASTKPQDAVGRLADALALATRPEEKKLALSILRDCRVPAAVELAAKCLDDPALAAEATDAILYLAKAQKKGSADLPPVTGPAANAALAKVSQRRDVSLPTPWKCYDIGSVNTPGFAEHANGVFTLKAAGADIWGKADACLLIAQPLSDDGSIVARVASLENTNPWAKAGVMARESLDAGSVNVFMGISPSNGATFQWRTESGGNSSFKGAAAAPPYWVRLTRAGDLFAGYVSRDGKEWQKVGEQAARMPRDVLIGLAVTSHSQEQATKARADGVEVALASARAEDKLRVLVVTGGHGFDRKAFAGMLDSFSDVAWREAQHPQANAEFAADKRTAYDVILLYDMNQKITDEEKGWLMDTLKEGKGLVVMHHALANYQRWNDWAQAIGGRYFTAPQDFQGKSWPRCTYKHGVKMAVQIADPQHPITKGVQDFDIEDETYKGYWVSPDVRVLLKVSHPECGEVVGWAKEHGQARVACMVLGHGPSAYGNANYRTLMQRAIQWAGKRLN